MSNPSNSISPCYKRSCIHCTDLSSIYFVCRYITTKENDQRDHLSKSRTLEKSTSLHVSYCMMAKARFPPMLSVSEKASEYWMVWMVGLLRSELARSRQLLLTRTMGVFRWTGVDETWTWNTLNIGPYTGLGEGHIFGLVPHDAVDYLAWLTMLYETPDERYAGQKVALSNH